MARLSLKLLGTPEVRHGERVVTFPTRKALALLVYLVVEGGTHSREKIIALFWPESDSAHGRAVLRRTLVHLRHTLLETTDKQEPRHLIIEHDFLGLDPASNVDLDLRVLEAASIFARLSSSATARTQMSILQEINQLQTAVNLYRGGFLEGFSLNDAPDFDGWASLQREIWHRHANQVFERLSHVQFESGDVTSAIETVTRWLTFNPLNEEAYRLLIQAHFAAGNREAALQAYENCRVMLARELDIKPAPQTLILVEQLRTGNPPRRTQARQMPEPALIEAPLMGREVEFFQLVTAYHKIARGGTQVVILEGEAGIGKTRLATEFLGWAAAQGADILQGRAFETGGRLPYQPLVEALRGRVEQENAPEDLLSDTWLAELSRLLPELRDRYPDLPPPSSEEATAKTRLFEAIARLGQSFAERTPLVLFIDDIQWADAASLDVLSYATRRWQESKTPVLLLLNLRTEALMTLIALADWLASLEHGLALTRLALGPLSADSTMQLVRVLAGEQLSDARTRASSLQNISQEEASSTLTENEFERFGRWLFSETGGQPFFVMETLKALLEQGVFIQRSNPGEERGIIVAGVPVDVTTLRGFLPSGVREVIHTRLARLTPDAFRLLVAGAVLGQRCTFERLRQVADLDETGGLSALDEILKARLWCEVDQVSDGRYLFAHDKIRDVVYAEAGDARRRIFHRRALETLRGMAPSAELAHHALAAGQDKSAFHFSLAAGDEAMQLFAVRDAIVCYEQAWHVVERPGEGEYQLLVGIAPSDLQHLTIQSGRAYELVNEFEKARGVYQAMLAFAQEASLSLMECAALNRLATLAVLDRIDVKAAHSFLQRAVIVAEQSGDVLMLAETEWNLAQVNYYASHGSTSLVHGKRALELARQLDRQELIARSLNVVAYASELLGQWEESERAAVEARALYQVSKNRAMEVDCLGELAKVRICDGRAQAGMDAAREALSISTEIENTWGQAYSCFNLAMGALELGDYMEALSFAQQAVMLARTCNLTMFLSVSLTTLGRVHRALFDMAAARSAHLEALSLNEPQQIPWIEMIADELCTDCVLAGEWAEAHTYARQALNTRRDSLYLYVGLTHWHNIEALIRAGDIEYALEDVKHFGERIGNSRRHRIPYLRSLAVLALSQGELEQATRHLQEAATLAEDLRLTGELWSIQAALGELFMARDEQEQAGRAFKRAATIVLKLAEKMGDGRTKANFLASPLIQRVLSLLR